MIPSEPIKRFVFLREVPGRLALLTCLALANACNPQTPLADKAQAGDIASQRALARLYVEGGDHVPKDAALAMQWYRRAAEQGDAAAQYELGRMLSDGTRQNANSAEADGWFRKAAGQGHAGAIQYLEAHKRRPGEMVRATDAPGSGGNPLQNKPPFASAGGTASIAEAQFRMGLMFSRGDRVLPDPAEAARWYRLAADQGHAAAMVNLGAMYGDGRGVEKNADEAIRLYLLAAAQGSVEAEFNLAVSYSTGDGVEKNDGEAVKWYRLAADHGFAKAQNGLGVRYANGDGVPKDIDAAVKLYRLAADQGDANAQGNLGKLYLLGKGVAKDPTVAAGWFLKSAEQGIPLAQYILGTLYAKGSGVPKDLVEANAWLVVADYLGNARAKDELIELQRVSTPAQVDAAELRASELIRQIEVKDPPPTR